MEYVLYIDVFVLVNFCMDLGLLLIVRRILKVPGSAVRLASAALCGTVMACAALFLPGMVLWLLASPAVMVMAAFRPPGIRELAKEGLILLFTAAGVGGIMEILYQHTPAGYYLAAFLSGNPAAGMPLLAWAAAAAGAFFLFRFLWLTAAETRMERAHLQMVQLELGPVKVQAAGFVDTGNRLREPESGRPVHIVSDRIWRKLQVPECRIRRIPYHTIGNPGGFLEAAEIDSLRIAEEASQAHGFPGRSRRRPDGGGKKGRPGDSSGTCRAWIGRAPFPVSESGRYEILLHEDI